MNTNRNKFRSIAPAILAVGLLLLSACGQKIAGNYSLVQTGGYQTGAYNASCSQISLAITDNGGAISATGSNACWTENLIGSESNNIITVTSLTQIPVSSTNSAVSTISNNCMYSGTLTVSNNVISGTLTSVANTGYNVGYSFCGTITVNGTKTN